MPTCHAKYQRFGFFCSVKWCKQPSCISWILNMCAYFQILPWRGTLVLALSITQPLAGSKASTQTNKSVPEQRIEFQLSKSRRIPFSRRARTHTQRITLKQKTFQIKQDSCSQVCFFNFSAKVVL